MSLSLIDRSSDLSRLRAEGYSLRVIGGFLVVREIPYVTERRHVQRGALVVKLTLSGERTAKPETHVTFFVGEHPCDDSGRKLESIQHQTGDVTLAPGLVANHSFSSKPPASNGYADYYEQVSTYASIISKYARSIDPSVSPRVHSPTEELENESPFRYTDTASSRAEIVMLCERFSRLRVAIIGLGGSGSYVLDQVAKTPVAEVHLFDDDRFLQHNAFRAPGAPSLEDLENEPYKVDWFSAMYGRMHRGIVSHRYRVGAENASELRDMNFVFVCVDNPQSRAAILPTLQEMAVPFVDVGMGLLVTDDKLHGLLRATSSTEMFDSAILGRGRVPVSSGAAEDVYSTRVQVADLNAMLALMAVIKWKKHVGFYHDTESEHHSVFAVSAAEFINDDRP